MSERVLFGTTKEARGNLVETKFILMAHPTGRRQGVVNERELMEADERGDPFCIRDVRNDSVKEGVL